MIQSVEKLPDVHFQNPAPVAGHRLFPQRLQRLVGRPPCPVAERTVIEVLFKDRLQQPDHRPLQERIYPPTSACRWVGFPWRYRPWEYTPAATVARSHHRARQRDGQHLPAPPLRRERSRATPQPFLILRPREAGLPPGSGLASRVTSPFSGRAPWGRALWFARRPSTSSQFCFDKAPKPRNAPANGKSLSERPGSVPIVQDGICAGDRGQGVVGRQIDPLRNEPHRAIGKCELQPPRMPAAKRVEVLPVGD